MSDPTDRLREEFVLRQAQAMDRAESRQRRNRRNGMLAGAAVGFVAVVVTVQITRTAVAWHAFLLETVLCGLAGWLLARIHGGVLAGVVMFAAAYLLAFGARAAGLDPSVLFAQVDLRGVAAVQGNFTSLCLVLSCGATLGHVMQD